MGINHRKAAIIGCGFVGSASVFALMQTSLFSELVLIDQNQDKAIGEALDISHGLPFSKPSKIYAGDYKDLKDAYVIIITAGAAQAPGETRLDLAKKNVNIFKSIIPQIVEYNKDAIILVVANPVDVLTYVTHKLSGYPANRVFGSGTVLDTARFKHLLGEHLRVDSRSVHAVIVGEHGDSEIAVWSSANVSGIPMHKICEMRGYFNHDAEMKKISDEVKNSAYRIIEKKGATYYGIAMSVKRICEAIVRDEKSILPVSSIQEDPELLGVSLSMPVIVGKDGIEGFTPISLDDKERKELIKSAETIKHTIETCEECK